MGDNAQRRVATLARQLTASEQPASSAYWSRVQQAPPDAILGITEAFKADPDARRKLNLGVGAYRTEEGKPLLLNVVKKAEAALAADEGRNKEYLPIGGDAEFCRLSRRLAFGDSLAATLGGEARAVTVQSLSGTGALRIGAELLARHADPSCPRLVLLPDPTWANHKAVFAAAGLRVAPYRYYDAARRGLDYDGLLVDLRAAPRGAIALLHPVAHNPTGCDPTQAQWRGILAVVQERGLMPFMDCAYQGFASGDLDKDAAAVRLFAAAGLEMLLAQSYAKNMGLYGERVGALTVVTACPETATRVGSQLRGVARAMYSSPPLHGAAVARTVLSDPALFAEWKEELAAMARRIADMRVALHAALGKTGAPGEWQHILTQIGMFSYTGLTAAQVDYLAAKWHVYMTRDGRISMAGLSAARAQYLADAIADAVRSC